MTVSPTFKNRIQSLDVLRGFAVLGILLANIFAFGWPSAGEMMGHPYPVRGINYGVEGVRVFLVSGKFRGLFCLLFGAGLFLQYSKLKAVGKWPGTYLWRNTILMIIGLIHISLIWFGDILLLYSLTAFVLMWMVRSSSWKILTMAGMMLGLSVLFGILTLGYGGGGPAQGLYAPANELRIFASSNYFEQFQFRAPLAGSVISFFPILILELGGLFLIGMWMTRTGILEKPSAQPLVSNVLIAIGLVGVLINLVIGGEIALSQNSEMVSLAEFGLNAPMSIGYAIFGAILVERFPRGIFVKLLAPVGRMALTSYLVQSLVCTTFFYGWGFGKFGQLDYFGLLGFVVFVWVVNLLFAHLWLSRFSMGPVEWVWRSLTLGRNASKKIAVDGAVIPPRLEP